MVHNRSPEAAKVAFFGALFAARTDIYATRWDNPHTGKHGWIPAVRGGWRKGVRHEDRGYLPLTAKVLESHLRGEVHVGLYPLLDSDRCWWLAAAFDKEEALIAAPLFRPARDKGATVFLDLENLEPYKDQRAYLSALGRMTPQEVRRAADKAGKVPVAAEVTRLVSPGSCAATTRPSTAA